MMDTNESHKIDPFELVNLLIGASYSIDILAITGIGLFQDSHIDWPIIADSRLNLRTIITHPDDWVGKKRVPEAYSHFYKDLLKRYEEFGFEVRMVNRKPTFNFIIIDKREAILADFSETQNPKHYHYILDKEKIQNLLNHFDTLWNSGHKSDLIYEDLFYTSLPSVENKIFQISNDYWDNLLKNISQNPKELYYLHHRKFEELIAELLLREGMIVKLTPQTRDGGRDIIAINKSIMGEHLFLVECKRYAPHRLIDVSMIRALYGVVEMEKASSGLIVTTSFFSPDALTLTKTIEHRMALKDYNDLTGWITNNAR